MNSNQIKTDGFSNPDSQRLMNEQWPDEPELRVQQSEDCLQCGGCSFYGKLNFDWGVCCNQKSRHHLETVFEHFTCASIAHEGWNAHSFDEDKGYWCRCEDYLPLHGENELLLLHIRVKQLEEKKWQAEYGWDAPLKAQGRDQWDAINNLRVAIDEKLEMEND